jgi:hypothetical protein
LRVEEIAACGMNCSLCRAFMREKNKCPGCNGPDTGKQKSCLNCSIKRCERLSGSESGFCYSCTEFPCKRLKHLDKRYRTKYGMSMICNLQTIETVGIDRFVEMEILRWACGKCGALLCVHRATCQSCGDTWNSGDTIRNEYFFA